MLPSIECDRGGGFAFEWCGESGALVGVWVWLMVRGQFYCNHIQLVLRVNYQDQKNNLLKMKACIVSLIS